MAATSRRNQAENNVTILKQAESSPLTEGAPKQPSSSNLKRASKGKSAPKTKPGADPQSKQDRVVAMLRRTEGATVAAVMKATGWQKHSVHGFFAGVVRKKLRLNLVSEKTGEERVYRIVAKAASVKHKGKWGRKAA